MVQILPAGRQKQTFAQKLNQGIGVGLEKGQQLYEKHEEKQLFEKENKAIKDAYGIDLSGIKDPKTRQSIITEELKGKRKGKEREEQLDLLKQFYNKENTPSIGDQLGEGEPEQKPIPQENAPPEPKKPKPLEKGRKKWSDEEIAIAQVYNPGQAKIMQSQNDITIREEREEVKAKGKLEKEERNIEHERVENLRKETLPFRQEIAQRAEAAQRAKESYEEQKALIDSGKLDDPSYAALLENLPFKIGQRFLSPETSEYKGALVQNFNILKNLFAGATRVKELDIVEDKIAGIYLTDTQKKAVIKSLQRAADLDIIKAEAALEIDQEKKPMGILEYQQELNKRTKQKQSALFDRVLDEQEAIIKDAENAKKMPLNWANPEHKEIMTQIYNEAGKNIKKAREMAQEKGYTW